MGCVCLYVYTQALYLHYPFICCCKHRLLSYLGYYESCYYGHWCVCISLNCCCHFFFLAIYPGMELLNHTVVLSLLFWETPILFFREAAPIYISTNSIRVPFPPHSCQHLSFGLFDDIYSVRCKLVFQCGFDLHFSYD